MGTKTIEDLQRKKKSGALAAGLNLILPGAGYMYCGRVILGIGALLFCVVMVAFNPFYVLPLWAILIIDGFLAADRYNKTLDIKIDSMMKKCPMCAEKISPEAKKCKHCGHMLEEVESN